MRKGLRTACLLAAAAVAALGGAAGGSAGSAQDQDLPGAIVIPPPLEKAVAVPGAAGWVDTGIDVGPGQEIRFAATGRVDLQMGNPEASCGPEGVDLVTVEQPVPNANLGALIGKVVQPVARRLDEDSGQEIRDEIFVLFLVGAESVQTVPFQGRLYLGINENVTRDNGGEFQVVVARRPL
ncbi:MAG: hypothetical protein KA243_04245 [Candidatus Aminicenantes bacterium]|nr:hypothetical protein [Candidatus Aminicenantes bacterium]NLH75720.1 hypothetical protein [Acidobacteriota bacterium]